VLGFRSSSRRFPVGLTIAAAIASAILIGLGVWQLHRLKWKEHLLARVAALRTAEAQPLAPVLARAVRGGDVEFTRVWADCGEAPAERPVTFRYGVEQGQMVWRPLAACMAYAPPFDGIVVDRGVSERTRGMTEPQQMVLPALKHVVGVLRKPGTPLAALGLRRRAPYLLVAENETPTAPPGVTPAPLPADIPNRHLEYALTWFGLAGALAGVYAALLWRRLKA
jgi:surfeit locus 1 family protein